LNNGICTLTGGNSEYASQSLYDSKGVLIRNITRNPISPGNGVVVDTADIKFQSGGTGFYWYRLKLLNTNGINSNALTLGLWLSKLKSNIYRQMTLPGAITNGMCTSAVTPTPMSVALKRIDGNTESYSYHSITTFTYVYKPNALYDTGQTPVSLLCTGSFSYTNGSDGPVAVTINNQPDRLLIIPKGNIIFTGTINVFSIGDVWNPGLQSEFEVVGNLINVDKCIDTFAGERIISLRSLLKIPADPINVTISGKESYILGNLPRRGRKNATPMNLLTLSHLGVTGTVCYLLEILSNNAILVTRRSPFGGINTNSYEICKPVGSKMYLFELPFYAREKFYVPRGALTPDNTNYYGPKNDFMNVGLHPMGLQITLYDPSNIYDSVCSLKIWIYAGESYNPCGFLHVPALIPKSTSVSQSQL